MKNKVVLAYSGGLDTTYSIIYLSKIKGFEVHTAIVNTGGFTETELGEIEKKAYTLGVKSHVTIDKTEEFYQKCVKYLIFGNVLRNHTYPMSVSAERIFQAMAIADYVNEIGADYVAHGSTGAGNDQVRFDLVFQVQCPQTEIITPIRDMKLSRQEEVDFLKEHGVDWSWEKAKYSINKGLWGTSVGGAETLTSSRALPNEAYPSALENEKATKIEIEFEKGEAVALNGVKRTPVQLIHELEELASSYAIGRDVHVGDTIIGIKGRVGFEAAAALILIKSHQLLEKHVLTKWQQYWKDQLATWYGMQVHEGQFLEPTLRQMESYFEDSQSRVSGKVYVELQPFRFDLLGIESDYDMMKSEFGSYGEIHQGWTGDDVKGFTKILGNATRIYHSIKEK